MAKKKTFVEKLAGLRILNQVNFSDVLDESSQKLKDEIFTIRHYRTQEQAELFKSTGEVGKLFKLIQNRTYELEKIVGDDTTLISVLPYYFVLTPDAYAMTYEEGFGKYTITIGTPTLCALYSGSCGFVKIEDVATFIDSILVHELAHCYGSMSHDKEFKKKFKEFCKILNLKPSV